ncbi:MAG: Asr1405/Asl0597 family protein [Gloeotrichia echinulata GP01]
MKPSEIQKSHIVEINWTDRWQVYQRLQDLNIPCWCETNQPLRVEICHPIAAIQLWSVIRQFTASRQDLIQNLKYCWQHRYQQF